MSSAKEKKKICDRYDTFIFDLDGTLLDTLGDLADSCNYALRINGYPERNVDEVRQFVGNGVKVLMERALPADVNCECFNRVYADFRKHYILHSFDKTKPYDGIIEMLCRLKKYDKNLAVVSNKMHLATEKLVAHFFGDYIHVAVGESENIRRKPASDTVIQALKLLGVGKERAVYLGDSDVDIATAYNSGLPCISVLWGFRDQEFLYKNGATELISAPDDIF